MLVSTKFLKAKKRASNVLARKSCMYKKTQMKTAQDEKSRWLRFVAANGVSHNNKTENENRESNEEMIKGDKA